MTRILTYNILFGGARRIDQITEMIRSARPDVVGLIEATDPLVVEALAKRLGMEYSMSGYARYGSDWQVALLSRLPIIHSQVHLCPGVLSRPLLEIDVQEEDGRSLTLFVTHLAASFAHSARGGDSIRRAEVREILRIMAEKRGMPHLVMGDFNSLAPGDVFMASRLLRYLLNMDQLHQSTKKESVESLGHADLNFVVPPSLRFLNPLLRVIPRNVVLSVLFDCACSLYAARGTVRLLRRAGYVDSFRRVNPHARGFTCPAKAPAGRIDYIFASPELAGRLSACHVVTGAIGGDQASDHLPVLAEFRPVGGERDVGTEESERAMMGLSHLRSQGSPAP